MTITTDQYLVPSSSHYVSWTITSSELKPNGSHTVSSFRIQIIKDGTIIAESSAYNSSARSGYVKVPSTSVVARGTKV
jgi:archaellum component FlaF (FlaF/FlaG flagellin family)